MKQPVVYSHGTTRFESGLAVFMALIVLAMGVLAVRPDWHESFHCLTSTSHCHQIAIHLEEHGHPQHAPDDPGNHDETGCAIECFANGHVDSVDPVEGSEPATRRALSAQTCSLTWHASQLGLSSPGRAPPSFAWRTRPGLSAV